MSKIPTTDPYGTGNEKLNIAIKKLVGQLKILNDTCGNPMVPHPPDGKRGTRPPDKKIRSEIQELNSGELPPPTGERPSGLIGRDMLYNEQKEKPNNTKNEDDMVNAILAEVEEENKSKLNPNAEPFKPKDGTITNIGGRRKRIRKGRKSKKQRKSGRRKGRRTKGKKGRKFCRTRRRR